ncbi:MAG: aminotransferase class V-fold PLP-dependent enzyme [Acidobacteriaceae bacterium]|nr:aminotransferase class V-fold PLP-dependent enzyme [Acidobacteriaceae bacterium]
MYLENYKTTVTSTMMMSEDTGALTDDRILELRRQFPILESSIYLYNCSQGALSTAVQRGMEEYALSWRTSSAPWDDWMERYDSIREEFAHFINASPDEIAILTSASAGINPIANALNFDGRNKVIMGEFEFPTMGHIWLAQRARGANIQFLPAIENRIPIDSYARAIDDRTMIVPLTHVSFTNGFRSDVAAITRLAHERDALVFVDGYQDCGTRPIDVKAWGVDFYVTGTLKYLLGPPGVAFLYVRRELSEKLMPSITSWMAQREVFAFNAKSLDPAPNARRFEGGSPPIPSIYAALPALQLLQSVGLTNVAAQIQKLTTAFLEGASELGIAIKTPRNSEGPLVVLRTKDPSRLVAKLTERRIVVSARHDGVRFAFHFYNTLDDVREALQALKDNLNLMVCG